MFLLSNSFQISFQVRIQECDFQEKPKGTLPHFSLLLPVAVELPHEYLWAFLENHIPGMVPMN